MGKVLISGGAGGGVSSDDTTTIAAHVLKGDTYLGSDTDDEAGTGTMKNVAATETAKSVVYTSPNIVMRMTNGAHITNASSGYPEVQIAASNFGDATTAYVYKGKKFTSSAGLNLTGAMTVNSLLSFSAAASSTTSITLTWKNPTAATGKPFSGVRVRYSTSSSPGKTGGSQLYYGSGNNTSSGGTSSTTVSGLTAGTKYYLSIYPYATTSAGELTGDILNTTVTTLSIINKTFTSGGTYTIPSGYTKIDIFCVGGGGGGCSSSTRTPGGGGGGGYTKTVTGISVSAGQALTITVGAGSTGTGGTSSVVRSGTTLCTASGGGRANTYGGKGGSGGGSGGEDASTGGNGGSNGSDGHQSSAGYTVGKGQGTTTRAFGSSSGTLYAGGGAGGGTSAGGKGGTGGGGNGGTGRSNGSNGSANTGGGGGGAGTLGAWSGNGGSGGSGIVLIKVYN